MIINSLSGGKTSSYLATHYPADYNIFSLVRIEDVRCMPKDKKLVQMVSDKIGMEFIATAEDDLTLTLMFDLEQFIGKEIIWVTGETFEQVNKKRKALPNQFKRFCTLEMKMKPIFEWWQKNINEIVLMGIGYRYDEDHRVNGFSTSFKTIIGKSKNGLRNKWGLIEWRIGDFPLITDRVNHWNVKQWADSTNLIFPPDSNCVGCFWKDVMQLRKNWEDNPEKMQWFADQEGKRRFKVEMKYESIKKLMLQSDFNYGTGSGCSSGECSN